MVDFKLYLIGDRTQCGGRSLADALGQACHAGVRAVQLREKDLLPDEFVTLAQGVLRALADYRPSILINDRADIACALQATGVHLPESGISPKIARHCLSENALIGCSTHSVDRARQAAEAGADFITFGPIYYTPSKASYGAPQGLETLKEVTQTVKIPVFAIGGITPDRVQACLEIGATGVAVISAILSAPDIPEAVTAFQHALGEL
ncbi:MAG TPA: thiamine phosphate synthase [candidate division Zixibacteria bacterium]|jgi:thiamine-phosphate pyrophosphorylase|nr:thiamine phosphate synthase [candidate division Zixibacteria bacterium]